MGLKMKLIDYIQSEYEGNKSLFARSIGKRPQQVTKWLKMDCIWFGGNVYRKQTDLKDKSCNKT